MRLSRDGPAAASSTPAFTLAIMFLVVVFNLADRQIINILAQDIKVDLRLSDAELGLLTGSATAIVYSCAGIPVAWWADRLHRPRMIAAMLAIWSACTVACGLAIGFVGLFFGRMGVGLGEGGAQPACTALVRDRFPGNTTSALAVMMVGNPIGSGVGLLLGGVIADQWGWRAAFIVLGVPGLVLAAIVLLSLRETAGHGDPGSANVSMQRDLMTILRNRRFRLLLYATVASTLVMAVAGAWVPAFFMRVHSLSATEIGFYAALAVGVCGSLGTAAGALCDVVWTKVPNIESKLVAVASAAIIPASLLITLGATARLSLIGMFLFNALAPVWLGPTVKLIQDSSGPAQRALGVALCSSAAILFGLGVGVPLTGWISDILAPTSGRASIGIALAILLPAASAAVVLCHLEIIRENTREARTGTAEMV